MVFSFSVVDSINPESRALAVTSSAAESFSQSSGKNFVAIIASVHNSQLTQTKTPELFESVKPGKCFDEYFDKIHSNSLYFAVLYSQFFKFNSYFLDFNFTLLLPLASCL